jgi:3-methyladenine DNA glycosylase AlkD
VDTIAAHRIGHLLEAHPTPMRRLLTQWSGDAHLWKRRAAILAQLTFKGRTDARLLYACIDPNLGMPTSSSARRLAGRCGSTRARTR